MKGKSSRALRAEFPWLKSRLPTLWTNSYFVSTVGGTSPAVIKQYIENQKTSDSRCRLSPSGFMCGIGRGAARSLQRLPGALR